MTRTVYILLLSMALCAPAWAQRPHERGGPPADVAQPEGVPPLVPRLFDALDANGDGMVERNEFESRLPEIVRRLAWAMGGGRGEHRPGPPQETPVVPPGMGERRFGRELERIIHEAVREAVHEELGRSGGPQGRAAALLMVFDQNHDGVIEIGEGEQVLERIRRLDLNADGRIDQTELEHLQRDRGPGDQPGAMFERRDKDGDGRLSLEEFGGSPERFERLDADGDGYVTPEEFQRNRQREGDR
jgi:Ca2+-binding EF-hand superfamily protein